MRNRYLSLLFCAVLLPLGGCSIFGGPVSPSLEYRKAVRSYETVGALVVKAIDEDFVSLDTAEILGDIDNAAYAELQRMREAIPTDPDIDRSSFDWHLARFRRILASLRELASDPEVSDPSTLPVGPDPLPPPNFGG